MSNVDLLYYTKDYPKLVELVARTCYQSFHKVDEHSHRFIRSIMSKGHLSIASVGNIVFGIKQFNEQTLLDLMKMKVANNFIRWSFVAGASEYQLIVSMNMLTFLDIRNSQQGVHLFLAFEALTDEVPELCWFYDREVELVSATNRYAEMGSPKLYEPVLLSEDYTTLKALNFPEEELDIHATVTLSYMTDRSTGLQLWRHSDMAGGTELSQRYVSRDGATFRELIGFHANESEIGRKLAGLIARANDDYNTLLEELSELGVHAGRAKEVARAILPNALATEIIQCRPMRQWKHLFALRDSVHAQNEAVADVRSMKKVLLEHGVVL